MSFSVKEELEDKSRQIEKMTDEIEKLDSALQQTRQDLYQEQLQCNDFEGQVYLLFLLLHNFLLNTINFRN